MTDMTDAFKEVTQIEEIAPEELKTPDQAAVEAVREAHKPPPEPKKILGEFDSEEEAIKAFTTLKSFAQQQLAAQQQQEQMRRAQEYEAQRRIAEMPAGERPVSEDEARMLKEYVRAVGDKKYDEALLTLKRGIEEKANRNAAALAQTIVRQELEKAVAPHRAKQQLLENQDLSDIHPVADHAVWLAEHLGQFGIPKKQVAGLIRDIGKSYAAHNFKRPETGGWEEPSNSWADLEGEDFDKASQAFWNAQLGLK